MRSGSSLNLISGANGVRNVRVDQVRRVLLKGSTNVGSIAGEVERHGVDREVTTGEVCLDLSLNSTSGLRESLWYASARCVVIS